MIDLERSVVESLDGQDPRLAPHLPYLLQDLWALGSLPDEIGALLREAAPELAPGWRVLDLGCGKGAVSIPLARELGVRVHGIDGCAPFIADAVRLAAEHGVADRCLFEVGDLRARIDGLRGYDLAILGSIGPVLGDIGATLRRVRACLAPGRLVVLDDGHAVEGRDPHGLPARAEVLEQIRAAGLRIRAERTQTPAAMAAFNAGIFRAIERRARELGERHPELGPLLRGYVDAQAAENDVLQNDVACVAWLLARVD